MLEEGKYQQKKEISADVKSPHSVGFVMAYELYKQRMCPQSLFWLLLWLRRWWIRRLLTSCNHYTKHACPHSGKPWNPPGGKNGPCGPKCPPTSHMAISPTAHHGSVILERLARKTGLRCLLSIKCQEEGKSTGRQNRDISYHYNPGPNCPCPETQCEGEVRMYGM